MIAANEFVASSAFGQPPAPAWVGEVHADDAAGRTDDFLQVGKVQSRPAPHVHDGIAGLEAERLDRLTAVAVRSE